MARRLIAFRIIPIIWVATLFVCVSFAAAPEKSAVSTNKLSFYRYQIESELASDWTTLTSVDSESTANLFGLFTDKKNASTKLMAFRFLEEGGKVCARERSTMNIQRVKYEKIAAPKGWECAFEVKQTGRVTAVRSVSIKGKSRATVFALVLVGEAMPKERFMKAVNSLKGVNR